MTTRESHSNGTAAAPLSKDATANGSLLPGTTLPATPPTLSHNTPSPPHTFPGPTINGHSTTTTLYEPAQLAASPLIPALHKLINRAFDHSHRTKGIPINIDRLPTTNDYIQQVGTDPGTFVYVVTWTATGEPVATAGAHRYVGGEVMAQGAEEGREAARSAFTRVRLPAATAAEAGGERAEVWELKLMAVDIAYSGRGLASYLMKLVDREVLVRRKGGGVGGKGAGGEGAGRGEVWMVLTTVTEANGEFYRRRGYAEDYETVHGPGFMGTPGGFRVVHMSKVLEG
ncbi:hypothetical protein LTR53_002358 [Teratosphaeriaceae sp. CCFEE 6253]|nr:hypothetical protein LTR53_002358 [Teratosphaeriaceae sp. CCFEE 6253]